MSEIKGPISPADAEVIAGWLDEEAGMYREYERILTELSFYVDTGERESHRLEKRAAAVRAAAREPLGKAWVAKSPGDPPSNWAWCDEDHSDAKDIAFTCGWSTWRVAIYEEGGE